MDVMMNMIIKIDYNLDLYIYSEGIQYGNNPSNSWDDNELYGSGDFIYFELWMTECW